MNGSGLHLRQQQQPQCEAGEERAQYQTVEATHQQNRSSRVKITFRPVQREQALRSLARIRAPPVPSSGNGAVPAAPPPNIVEI